jgi:LL-diaminopimelate aminotransferase
VEIADDQRFTNYVCKTEPSSLEASAQGLQLPFRITKAQRIQALPPYLFAEIDRLKREVAARGVDLINLGIGDPDTPTPAHIVARLAQAAANPQNHRYPDYEGLLSFRQAAAGWLKSRYGVTADPATEIVSLIGSKEGIANMAVAFVDPDDVVLVPDPGYPVYHIGTSFNGGVTYRMPLRRENGFLPDLGAIPAEVARRAKLLWLNYPNNPTATVAPRAFFADAVRFAERNNIIICHDAAYAEIYFGERPPSILEVDGGREVAIEFHSLSKTFNMTGWRIGFAAGHRELIAGLGKVKTNVDSGVFQAVQEAAIAALTGDASVVDRLRAMYRERRDVLVEGLRSIGLPCDAPAGTFYVWVPVPRGTTAAALSTRCLMEAGVVVTPGNGFGDAGEGFIRLTLCSPVERLREAVERLRGLGL